MRQPPKNGSDDGVTDYSKVIVTTRELANVLALSEPHVFTLKRRNIIQPVKAKKPRMSWEPRCGDMPHTSAARITRPMPIFVRKERLRKRLTADCAKSSSNKPKKNCIALKM